MTGVDRAYDRAYDRGGQGLWACDRGGQGLRIGSVQGVDRILCRPVRALHRPCADRACAGGP